MHTDQKQRIIGFFRTCQVFDRRTPERRLRAGLPAPLETGAFSNLKVEPEMAVSIS
jgi:hypothetical protein